MIRKRRVAYLAGMLLALSGGIQAQPAGGQGDPFPGPEKPQVWGDPEEEGPDAKRGWTWFGMGYESRTRSNGASTASENGGAESGRGSAKGRSGR